MVLIVFFHCFHCFFIVSIDRPRLGADQNKVVGVGVLFFVLSSIEGCMRVSKVNDDSFLETSILL